MASREDDQVWVYNFFGSDGSWLHCGQTKDPDRRRDEHRRNFRTPAGFLRVEAGPMPRWMAREWEREQQCSPFGNGPYSRPCADPAPPTRDDWFGTVLALAGGAAVVGAVAAWFTTR